MTAKETLPEIRRILGFTQADLAKVMGCSQSAVAKWETGENPLPKWATVILAQLPRNPQRKRRKPFWQG